MTRLEDAIKLLESYGIYGAKEGDSGAFEIPKKEFVLEKYEVLGERRYSKPSPIKPLYIRPMFLPCLFGFEPWCWVRKYKDPVIDFVINAIAVDDVHVHLLAGRITGKIVTEFFNKSEEGETWEENVKTGEVRNREKVKGSAELSGDFFEEVILREIQEKLAEIKNIIKRTKPDDKIRIESEFEKKGYLEMIKSILSLLLTGSIYVDDKIKVRVSYTWLGEERVTEKEIRVKAYLPVRNVNWHL